MAISNAQAGEIYFIDESDITSANKEESAIYLNELSKVPSTRDEGDEENSAEDDVYVVPSIVQVGKLESSANPKNIITSKTQQTKRPVTIEDDYDEDHYALARLSVYSGHYSLAEESEDTDASQIKPEKEAEKEETERKNKSSSRLLKEGKFQINRHHVVICVVVVVILIVAAGIGGAIFGNKHASNENSNGKYFLRVLYKISNPFTEKYWLNVMQDLYNFLPLFLSRCTINAQNYDFNCDPYNRY